MKKIYKKICICTLSIIVTILTFCSTEIIYAANNTLSGAITYTMGNVQKGTITENQENYYYKFTIPASGEISGNITANMYKVRLYIYDAEGTEIWSRTYSRNTVTGKVNEDYNLHLTKGTYYFCVKKYYDHSHYEGAFSFTNVFTSANETFEETGFGSNNEIEVASPVNANSTTYIGQLAANDYRDFYKLSIQESGKITLNLQAKIDCTKVYLYDDSGIELWHKTYEWNAWIELINIEETFYLTKGTYYILIREYDDYYDGNYSFSLNYTSSNESFVENMWGSNDSIRESSPIQLDKSYKGQIALNEYADFYKIEVTSPCTLYICLGGNMEEVNLLLFDSSGNEMWTDNVICNDATGIITYANNENIIEAGTYYLRIYGNDENYGDYSLNISKYKKVKKISIKIKNRKIKIGKKYNISVKFKPYNASNKNIIWKSSNKKVIKVTKNGKIKIRRKGTAIITARSEENSNIYAKCKITVKAKKIKVENIK